MNAQDSTLPEQARLVTREILERMGIPSVVTAREDEDAIRITIHAHDSGLLIGKQGATLNALQLLVGLIVNRSSQARKLKVILDAEGYRSRRQASLEATAHRVAEKAIATGKVMEIHTMSSYERRIIHMTLAPVAGVVTRSEGEGPARRLLVIPDNLGSGGEARREGGGRRPRGGRSGRHARPQQQAAAASAQPDGPGSGAESPSHLELDLDLAKLGLDPGEALPGDEPLDDASTGE